MKNIYEIHTAVWLSRLSQQQNKAITLSNVPDKEIERIAQFGIDTLWLMGVWQRSADAARVNATNEGLVCEIKNLLPDFTLDDIIGSAYAVRDYTVDARFGGEAGLTQFRERLAARGIKLLLDFVPNHTAFDNPWITEKPEYYISTTSNISETTHRFRAVGDAFVAHGQDPTLPPWSDVAQVNAFSESYRQASIDTLRHIATLADGVRCDMAMLLINDIFATSWGELAGATPEQEYWQHVITAVREQEPAFTFIAECYWDTEQKLVELGFDYVYDKTIYDYFAQHNRTGAEYHLASLKPIEDHLLHFLENHDEPRAATIFSTEEQLANAEFIMNLPGSCLWHDGQFEGCQKKLPVHIRRGPIEQPNDKLLIGYAKMFGK